jgi:Putative prokaryotic signal transducing protein
MVAVTVVQNEAEAEVVCGLLRANGIACEYRQTSFGAGTMDGMRGGPQEVFVAEADAGQARSLIGDD